jgi:hypothetical protein
VDEKIIQIANELIRAVKESGRDVTFFKDGECVIPVVVNIKVFEHYIPARTVVDNINNNWEIHGDYVE